MPRWRRLLAGMLSADKAGNYTYAEAASVLIRLGYELAPNAGGSHRKWRRRMADGSVSVIGLVEKGSGKLKAYLIRDMVHELQRCNALPRDGEYDAVDN